jgi:hypothetical protein
MLAALNAGKLIHGHKTNKQECGLASFDSNGSRQSPLPRTVGFVEYVYFLLKICHAIHLWVLEQDEAKTDSETTPDFESIFDVCCEETQSKMGDSSMLAICILNVFHLPSPRTKDLNAVCILVLPGLCLWQSRGRTRDFGRGSILLQTWTRRL